MSFLYILNDNDCVQTIVLKTTFDENITFHSIHDQLVGGGCGVW